MHTGICIFYNVFFWYSHLSRQKCRVYWIIQPSFWHEYSHDTHPNIQLRDCHTKSLSWAQKSSLLSIEKKKLKYLSQCLAGSISCSYSTWKFSPKTLQCTLILFFKGLSTETCAISSHPILNTNVFFSNSFNFFPFPLVQYSFYSFFSSTSISISSMKLVLMPREGINLSVPTIFCNLWPSPII